MKHVLVLFFYSLVFFSACSWWVSAQREENRGKCFTRRNLLFPLPEWMAILSLVLLLFPRLPESTRFLHFFLCGMSLLGLLELLYQAPLCWAETPSLYHKVVIIILSNLTYLLSSIFSDAAAAAAAAAGEEIPDGGEIPDADSQR